MTKQYVAGDKSRAICPHCEHVCPTSMQMQNMTFETGTALMLVAVCDVCNKVVGIPYQGDDWTLRDHIQPITQEFVDRIKELTDGVEINLDKPLDEKDE